MGGRQVEEIQRLLRNILKTHPLRGGVAAGRVQSFAIDGVELARAEPGMVVLIFQISAVGWIVVLVGTLPKLTP